MSIELAALRIGFIGAGRVAQTLAPAFDRANLNVAAFYNRGSDAAQRLGSRVRSARPLPPGVRALYHASAYYVGPFLIALLKEGVELWKSFGASEADALRAMMPLLRGTVAAVLDGGLANGMGGCVARGDVGTILKHLEALDERFPASGALYRELALRNVPLGIERGTLSSRRAAEIENLLLRTRTNQRSVHDSLRDAQKRKGPGSSNRGP